MIAIVGPTASGKTDLSIALAKKFKGEIISADSRQLYKGMEIGADVIVGSWRRAAGGGRNRRVYVARGVPHHLIAFRSPAKPLTAGEFKRLAVRKAGEIAARGNVPFLVGGTGLYVSAVVDNFSVPEVPPDPGLRARLSKLGAKSLYARLVKKDPEYAVRISPANKRYMIRALEVIAATGRPFSALQKRGEPLFDVLQIGVSRPRDEVNKRIGLRVDAQMHRGLLKEAARLGKRYGWDLPTMSGLGHRQLGLHLQGKIRLEEAVRLVKRDTRRYAKRQMTWLRRDKSIHWVQNQAEAVRLVRKHMAALKRG
jgi:tRNA dimethylallyltransferase